jgi:hypothetical protein
MEQNNNNTPDTREYEGRRYRLVTDEIDDSNECERCPLQVKCYNEDSCICEDLFGEGSCAGKRLEDVTDLLTERQAYDDYQERTVKSGDRADQLAWAIVALLAAQLIGGSKYGEMYVMAAGALAYLLLSTLQSAWQGLAIWIVKQRISRGQHLTDYPSWLGGTAWVLYALKLCALTAAAVYGIVHFLRLL